MSDTLVITAGTVKGPVMDTEGRNVMITGNGCEVTLSGPCEELRVIGDGHRISAEFAGVVDLLGSGNQVHVGTLGSAKFRGTENEVTWKKAPEGQLAPKFSLDAEDGNTVSMTS